MATDRVDFIFNLLDKVSGPAGKATDALERMDRAAGTAKRTLASVGDAAAHAGRRLGSALTSALGSLKTWLVGGAAVGLIGMYVRNMLKAADEAERARISMGILMGSQATGDRVLGMTERVGSINGASLAENREATRMFALAGFKEKEMPFLLAAAGDMRAVRGESGMTSFIEAIRRAKQTEDPRELGMMMRMLRETGIGEDLLFKNLKKAYPAIKDFRKALTEGLIDKNVFIGAILGAVQDMEGGALGRLSVDMGDTIGGLFEGIKTNMERRYEGLLDTKGFGLFKGFLENIRDVMDPSSPDGKRFTQSLKKMSDAIGETLFGKLQGAEGKQQILEFLDNVTKAATEATKAIVTLGGAFGSLGKGLGYLMSVEEKLTGHAPTVSGGGGPFASLTSGALESLARAVDAGKMKSLGSRTEFFDAYRAALKREGLSDSQIDSKVGRMSMGLDTHFDKKTMDMYYPQPVLPPASTTQPTTPTSSGAKGPHASIQMENHFHINSTGNVNDDAELLSRKVAELLPTQLGSAFEQMGIETGAV